MSSISDSLPRPLALAWHAVEHARTFELADTLEKFFELLVRYATLVDLARYVSVNAGAADAEVERQLSGWAKPGFGTWHGYLRVVQRALVRLEMPTILPVLSTALTDPNVVEFTRRKSGRNSVRVSLDDFIGAVVKWRNDAAHRDGVQQDREATEVIRMGAAELMEHCRALKEFAPVWVETANFFRGPKKSDWLEISYVPARGTAALGRAKADLDATWRIGGRALYLWSKPEKNPLPLTPFFQWDEQDPDLFMFSTLERGEPTYTAAGKARTFPDPARELRETASFLFAGSPHTEPEQAGSAKARFRELAIDAGEDGVYSPEERNLLERQRVRLGVSEDDARDIMASALAAHPDSVGAARVCVTPSTSELPPPPPAAVTFNVADPAPPEGHGSDEFGSAWAILVGLTDAHQGHTVRIESDDTLLMQGPDGKIGVFAGEGDLRKVAGRMCRIAGRAIIRDHEATTVFPSLNGELVSLALMCDEDILILGDAAYGVVLRPEATREPDDAGKEQIVLQLLANREDDDVWVRPNIPPQRLSNALSSFAKGAPLGQVLMLHDTTIMGSGKAGLLLTSEHYWGDDGIPMWLNTSISGPIESLKEVRLAHDDDGDRRLELDGVIVASANTPRAFALGAVLHLLGGPRPIVDPIPEKST